VATCGDFDLDDCLEWSPPVACAGGTACAKGACFVLPTDASCAEINDCASGCDEAECQQACYEGGAGAAQLEYGAMLACFAASGCVDDACLYNRCGPAIAACLFDVAGGGSCEEIGGCVQTCAQGDEECGPACAQAGGADAQGAWVSYAGCLGAVCPGLDAECLATQTSVGGACAVASAACFAPEAAGSNCLELTDCVDQCGDDETCAIACYQAAAPLDYAEFGALQGCAATSGCASLGCLGTTCAYEWAQCIAPSAGAGGCAALGACVSECGDGLGTPCADGCLAQASLVSQARYVTAFFCVLTVCPTQDAACSAQAAAGPCAPAVVACQQDAP
jgi:hypothetical protein